MIVLNPPPPPVPVNVAPANQVVYGSWGPSGCGPVGPTRVTRLPKREVLDAVQGVQGVPQASSIGAGCEWRVRPGDPDRVYLYRDGKQVGGWDSQHKRWMDYDADKNHWKDGYPPWQVNQLSINEDPKVGKVFFGVDRQQVPQTETFSVNGQQALFRTAQEVFGSDTLSDDSGKLRIAMCGTKEVCDTVMSDMKSHPALASLSSKFLVQAYRPGTWPVEVFKRPAGEGFFLSILGAPDKKHRAVEYHTQVAYEGPQKLSEAIDGALRRADPNYDPNKTPDLTKPKPPPAPLATPTPEPASTPGTIWLIVALLVAFIFGGKRNANSK